MTDAVALDGSTGGGQLLRTALSLSMVTGRPFAMEHVRAARPEPGLKPQHLAAVTLAADLCDAAVEGAALGSRTVTFRPGALLSGSYHVDIGTAGSITLLFDTVLPVAASLSAPITVSAIGGTDVRWAPTIEYYRRVKLPLVGRFGLAADVTVEKSGFYPAGGGAAVLKLAPSIVAPITVRDRGALDGVEVYSKAAASLEAGRVAERQAAAARRGLAALGVPAETRAVEYVDARSAGSSLLLRGVYDRAVVGFDSLGERGKPAETVAAEAVEQFRRFHATAAAVDRYLGDQLMVFLALSGGAVRAPTATDHVRTNRAVVRAFGYDVTVSPRDDETVVIAG